MMRSKRTSGQSIAEFALSLPIVLLVIFIFMDLGRAIYYFTSISNAVREGARYAMVHTIDGADDRDDVIDHVTGYSVAVKIEPGDVSVTCTGTSNDHVTVAASYEFDPVTPFLAELLSGASTMTLTTESTMRLAPIGECDL